MNDKVNEKLGLALGGLGGFNAHDAGVLAAAHDCDIKPAIITCTSGAILWTHLFLTKPESILDEMERQASAVAGASALQVAMLGYPGVFRPAYASYWARWLGPRWRPPIRSLLDRLFPAQIYEPTRPDSDFEEMADDFNLSKTPVMFNAYAVKSGRNWCSATTARSASFS